VVFPSLAITRALPLNQRVVIELTPPKGELTFTCGMKMLRGTLVAR
jgi:plastocyanin domain-containing protein